MSLFKKKYQLRMMEEKPEKDMQLGEGMARQTHQKFKHTKNPL